MVLCLTVTVDVTQGATPRLTAPLPAGGGSPPESDSPADDPGRTDAVAARLHSALAR